jgi:hypothetical protein
MANLNQLTQLVEKGVGVWNPWRWKNPNILPDLTWANLSGANLTRADLSGADLTQADLSNANLTGAALHGAKLSRAALNGAILSGASLNDANLSDANLTEAHLYVTVLLSANLSGANLTRADLYETVFTNTNLKGAQGLDACHHFGPCSIDHRTLAASGPLPLSFLRGCGLPDELIDYLPSLLNQAIQFYSCFLSYSSQDQAFAERLYADLQSKNVRCWFAPHNMQGGKKLHEQIDEAIRVYQRLLLILSEASMNSEWVKTEIANARRKEKSERGRVLFPIALAPFETIKKWKEFDADTGKDSAREIREYFIPDFSDWKNHDKYEAAFGRLLKDLKADELNPTKP